jgi:hypothetical protein
MRTNSKSADVGKTTYLTPYLDMVELGHGKKLPRDPRYRGRLMRALKRIRQERHATEPEMITHWRLFVPKVRFPSPEYFAKSYDCWSPERLMAGDVDKRLDRELKAKESKRRESVDGFPQQIGRILRSMDDGFKG